MSEMKIIKLGKYSTEENWNYYSGQVSYTGHVHYGSPYETCSDCGNCDGAKCDVCKKVVSSELLYQYSEEDIINQMKASGLFNFTDVEFDEYATMLYMSGSKDINDMYVVTDYSDWELQHDNPELYEKLTTDNQALFALLDAAYLYYKETLKFPVSFPSKYYDSERRQKACHSIIAIAEWDKNLGKAYAEIQCTRWRDSKSAK